jgi:hypothetical protein
MDSSSPIRATCPTQVILLDGDRIPNKSQMFYCYMVGNLLLPEHEMRMIENEYSETPATHQPVRYTKLCKM